MLLRSSSLSCSSRFGLTSSMPRRLPCIFEGKTTRSAPTRSNIFWCRSLVARAITCFTFVPGESLQIKVAVILASIGSLIATTTVASSSTPAARMASSSVQSTTRLSIEASNWRNSSIALWLESMARTSAPERSSSAQTEEPNRPTPTTAKAPGSPLALHCHQVPIFED